MNGKNYTYRDGGVFIRSMANTAEHHGIGQYRYPLNFELAGRKIAAEAGDREHTLDFDSKTCVLFDGAAREYECIKCTASMYFVRIGTDAAIIDFGGGAVTFVLDGEFVCGVIKDSEGAKAHEPAGDEMVGTKVRWTLGCGRYVDQDFTAADRMNVSWSPRDEKVDEVRYGAVKVGGPFYLVCAESGVLKDVCAPFFTERVVMLQDYDRCMTYGCVFGKGIDPIMITGYASFL